MQFLKFWWDCLLYGWKIGYGVFSFIEAACVVVLALLLWRSKTHAVAKKWEETVMKLAGLLLLASFFVSTVFVAPYAKKSESDAVKNGATVDAASWSNRYVTLQGEKRELEASEARKGMNALEQKHFETILSIATNADPIRAAISHQMPEPVQLPMMTERFELAAVRNVRDQEAKRQRVAEALVAHDKADAERIDAENAKISAEKSKAKAGERLRICKYVAAKFVSYLENLASDFGDAVSADNTTSLERNVSQITNFTKVQMKGHTNWNFGIGILGNERSAVDTLMIVCPQNEITNRMHALSPRLASGLGAAFVIRDERAVCRLLGTQNLLANKSGFPIGEWQPYADLLGVFMGEVDARYPIKAKKSP
jgi:hypothetical protein